MNNWYEFMAKKKNQETKEIPRVIITNEGGLKALLNLRELFQYRDLFWFLLFQTNPVTFCYVFYLDTIINHNFSSPLL